MYSTGVFYAWDFLAIIAMTIAYWICPEKIIKEKNEYVKFFLLFFSVFFLLFFIITNVLNNRDFSHFLFKIGTIPALFLFHIVYPFKAVKRNQHVTFFLFFLSLYILGLYGLIVVLHAFSNM